MEKLIKRPDLIDLGLNLGIEYPRTYQVDGVWFISGTRDSQPCTFKIDDENLINIQIPNGTQDYSTLVQSTHGIESAFLRLLE